MSDAVSERKLIKQGRVAIIVPLVVFSCLCANADNICVSVESNNTIEEYDSQGKGKVFASSGLNGPWGLAFDETGNLYVGNYWSDTIEKFNDLGQGTVFASSFLDYPVGLAFDSSGNLYVANQGNGTIVKFDSMGRGAIFASGLTYPTGLAFDSSGNLYVNSGGTVVKFNSLGQGVLFASSVGSGDDLAFAPNGNLYVSGGGSGYPIYVVSPQGQVSPLLFSGVNPNILRGLAFDSSGNLYVTEEGDAELDEISPSGQGKVIAMTGEVPEYVAVQVPEPPDWAILALSLVSLGFRGGFGRFSQNAAQHCAEPTSIAGKQG